MNLDSASFSSETISVSREADATGVGRMTFEIYLDDARYTVPTLKLVAAPDDESALKIGQLLLDESPHHLGVEICQDGQRIAGLGSYEAAR